MNGNVVVGRNFTGTITRANDHGFQIDAYPGEWFNCSKFNQPQLTIPPVGTVVEVTLDGSGFVRAIVPSAQAALPLPGPDRGQAMSRSIIRQVAIKAAARFLAGTDTSVDAMLSTAEAFAAWVERDS